MVEEIKSEEKVGVGTVVQFFDVTSASKKARSKWMRGRIFSKTSVATVPVFLIVRENGTTYLVYPKDMRKDKVTTPFKTPKSFAHFFVDETLLKQAEDLATGRIS